MADKKKSIHIPESVINDIENEPTANYTTDPGATGKERQLIEKSVTVALENFNDLLKKKGLPGWDESETESITKLGVIVAEKHLPNDLFSHSPEIILALALTSITVENVLSYREIADAIRNNAGGGEDDSEK